MAGQEQGLRHAFGAPRTEVTAMGTLSHIRFMSRRDVQRFSPVGGSALIAIHDRSEEPLSFDSCWGQVLHLRFHDASPETLGLELFDQGHAKRVMDFAREARCTASELIVHCHAGSSRSAAIGLFLASHFQLPCSRDGQLHTVQTWRLFNRHVYRLLSEEVD